MREIKYIKGAELRKLQLVLLDVLSEVDRVCRLNNIRYCIGYGTLLGAVRHGGFIPWDDDADVIMLRGEYEKFKKVADQLDPDICFFQDHDTDSDYMWGFGKARRSGTKYIRVNQEHLTHRSGFMIDIFPFDDIPKSTVGMVVHDWICFVLRKITYAQVAWVSENSIFWRSYYKMLSCIPAHWAHVVSRLLVTPDNAKTPNRARVLFGYMDGKKNPMNTISTKYGWDKSWFLDLVEYEFEGRMFYGPRDYDSCLSWAFGPNYMTPPPINDRESHAPCSDYSFGNL